MDLAQSAMRVYDSTNNDLIDARDFYLVLFRVKRWGVVGRGGEWREWSRCKWVEFILITVKTSTQLTCFKNWLLCYQGRTGPTKVADVLSTSRISKSTFLTLNLALKKMQCTNHCQSSNKPNTSELNDFALFRVLWSNGHGKAFVRQGAFNSEGHLYYKQCVESRLI